MTTPTYKYPDNYVASFKTVRDLNTTLRTDLLPKTGGIITGPIYQNTDTSEMTQLATKQYVLDNAGTGGGGGGGGGSSHPDKIESQDVAKSTSVLCTTDGVFFSDDSTTIAHLSKDDTSAKLASELAGLTLATDNLLVTNKTGTTTIADFTASVVQVTAPVRYASETTQATAPSDIPPLSQVNSLIATAKQNVSQLVDANGDSTTDNNYRLKVDNNRLEFARGVTSDDTWLKLFGSTTGSSDGVVQQTNRSNFFFESEDNSQPDVTAYLAHKNDQTAGSTYLASAPLRLTSGTSVNFQTPYARVSAMNTIAGGANTNLVMHPQNTATTEITNKINANARVGYASTVGTLASDDFSILSKGENDQRYYLNSTRLDQIVAPSQPLSLNSKKIVALAPGTSNTDAVNLDQLTSARQGFSVVRKTTNTQTANAKVTGFVLQQESNATKCYWDNANQTFLVSIPVGDTFVDVEFRVRITYNISATGNQAVFVLRDFTNNTSYTGETTLHCVKQNQTGSFSETVSIIKRFDTNRFVGLFVVSQNGSPPFSSLDIVMQAVTITTSTQVNLGGLSNAGGTRTVSLDGNGLRADQQGNHVWDLNGGVIKGLSYDFQAEPYTGDHVATLDYVNQTASATAQTAVLEQLTNADFQRFGASGLANAFAIRDMTINQDRFVIQTDLPANTVVLNVLEDLRLNYYGPPTLTANSIMRKSDIEALIQGGGQRRYTAYIYAGDFPPDATFSWDSSPAGLITSVGNTVGSSVRSIDVNHTAIPFKHRVFIQKFSTSFATADNDESQQYWVVDPLNNINRTQTRISYEQLGESVAQTIGFNIQWVEW